MFGAQKGNAQGEGFFGCGEGAASEVRFHGQVGQPVALRVERNVVACAEVFECGELFRAVEYRELHGGGFGQRVGDV